MPSFTNQDVGMYRALEGFRTPYPLEPDFFHIRPITSINIRLKRFQNGDIRDISRTQAYNYMSMVPLEAPQAPKISGGRIP